MILYLILVGVAVIFVGGTIACYKIRKASHEIDRLFKPIQALQSVIKSVHIKSHIAIIIIA